MKAVRFALVMLLAPIVLFASSTPAMADVVGPVKVSIRGPGVVPSTVTCGVQGYYIPSTHGLDVGGEVTCEGGPLGGVQGFFVDIDYSHYEVRFNGSGCQIMAHRSANGKLQQFSLGGGLAASSGCVINEVCITAYYEDHIWGLPDWDWEGTGCAPFVMGIPPEPGGLDTSCPVGTPLSVTQELRPLQTGGTSFAVFITVTFAEGRTPGVDWRSEAVYSVGSGDGSSANDFNSTGSSSSPGGTGTWSGNVLSIRSTYSTANGTRNFRGVQVNRVGGGTPFNNGLLGMTEPQSCVFYFGDPIRPESYTTASLGADQTHTPFGPLGDEGAGEPWEPPVVDPLPIGDNGCDVSLLDPSSWLCALGGLLDMLLDGLVGLFVPSEGFITDAMDQLKDSASDTTVGNYLAAFSGIAPPNGGSGCEGPAVNLNVMGSGGETHYPMNACSGPISALPPISRLIISIAVSLFGGIACMRILGKSFGWDPSIGRGGDA